jgi:predicted RNA binding protein YcfA (HicA-like mRNA interferase family)
MLEEDGWFHVGTEGDHWQFRHPTKPGKVTVVHPRKDATKKTLRSMEKQSGITFRK